jgi:hypothetical protein
VKYKPLPDAFLGFQTSDDLHEVFFCGLSGKEPKEMEQVLHWAIDESPTRLRFLSVSCPIYAYPLCIVH